MRCRAKTSARWVVSSCSSFCLCSPEGNSNRRQERFQSTTRQFRIRRPQPEDFQAGMLIVLMITILILILIIIIIIVILIISIIIIVIIVIIKLLQAGGSLAFLGGRVLLHKTSLGHPAKAQNLKIIKRGFHPLYETCVPKSTRQKFIHHHQ